jgi:hypothetical protein
MFVPAPIDRNYIPYTKRPVLPRNQGLFVDATGGGRRGAPFVVPQLVAQHEADCSTLPQGAICKVYPTCINGRRLVLKCNASKGCTDPEYVACT